MREITYHREGDYFIPALLIVSIIYFGVKREENIRIFKIL